MKAHPHGKKWEISYRCPGYQKVYTESFDTEEEANLRIAEIELLKKRKELMPPSDPSSLPAALQNTLTVARLLELYVNQYGLTQWSPTTMSYNRHRIDDYIVPYIGNWLVKDITTASLEAFYQSLLCKPVKHRKGHHDEESTISISVIEKIHAILRSALNQAIRWGYLNGANPALAAKTPKARKEKRAVWTNDEVAQALNCCTDQTLLLCMLLALFCSLRIGEILALTWDSVYISDDLLETHSCYLLTDKQLQRCDNRSLNDLKANGRSDSEIKVIFPPIKQTAATTSLVLKTLKTESSIRKVFLSDSLARYLKNVRQKQEDWKRMALSDYQDYNIVVAQDNGRPYERRLIDRKMKAFIEENELREVVFHSLRHCSVSIKLQLSHGNIKAVQGDTGHAQADMVTNVYADQVVDEQRRNLAQEVDRQFLAPFLDPCSEERPSAAPSVADPAADVYRLLKDSPEMAAIIKQLLIARQQDGFPPPRC